MPPSLDDLLRRYLPRPIVPVPVSRWYSAGLLAVGLTLLALQIVYLVLIALVAWLTYRYLLIIPALLATLRVHLITILLVASPFVAGLITTFFLFKPLLARTPKHEDLLILSRNEEPLLFAYVDRVCEVVGSPKPRQIGLDLQVNAFARLYRGWLGLFTGEVTLTLGLPLVAGLNLPQLTGVLAHEFGHFSQKAGMRLHFLIVSIRIWFARVAYERDAWDQKLEEWGQREDWRLRMPLVVARLAVSSGRWILRGLLRVGDYVSAWFSRQMEFDADRHEASVVGAQVFEQTTLLLSELGYADARAWQAMERAWLLRRVPDQFPALVERIHDHLEPPIRIQLNAQTLAEPTHRWATHPSPQERIQNVQSYTGLRSPQESDSPEPSAKSLFHDFEELSRSVTRAHYKRTLGDKLEAAELVEGQNFALEKAGEIRALDAIERHFPGKELPSRWYQLNEVEPHQQSTSELPKDYWEVIRRSLNRRAGLEFLSAGGKIRPESFELSSNNFETSRLEMQQARASLESTITALRHSADPLDGAPGIAPELRAVYNQLASQQDAALELRHLLIAYRVICENAEFLGLAEAPNARERAFMLLTAQYDTILKSLESAFYPAALLPQQTPQSLTTLLTLGIDPITTDCDTQVSFLLDRLDLLSERALGEICLSVERLKSN